MIYQLYHIYSARDNLSCETKKHETKRNDLLTRETISSSP